jgi:hypothetical protein
VASNAVPEPMVKYIDPDLFFYGITEDAVPLHVLFPKDGIAGQGTEKHSSSGGVLMDVKVSELGRMIYSSH